ncbi:4-oxalomesaconate tautomerase [Pseudorhizobium pelagicum]|uniref:4-oxalomesaconate tautomerase n=1 Tax=Pseudorhizobium pelagicum TaxID=1509405 RepID=A0A922P4K0_9HYPH|nr:4-oxalomesaconate tautomerase [Pseudorhizobium pelagicum]KEQ08295.1 4-oxalomesaconate tautomerase [Pseudorhizobium pelagicum]KEQ09136.1 4-oxalomesaconate tautomerase [Pseudorhizobium pelagicum]
MPRQHSIPCILMRGGTSKGPYFRMGDIPQDVETRARVLLAAMGSPDARQIDGLGGADTLTSKVALVGPSTREGVDVDYLFAQVSVDKAAVDTAPSCGNMLSGVGPFAIETGMVPITGERTSVVIYDINTQSRIEALVHTSDGAVDYEGEARIDGVPGSAAEIRLNFMDIVGSKTGALLPTGKPAEEIDGVNVTLIDVAVPMMIFRAADLGKTGYETAAELDADAAFFARIEAMRMEAGRRMGLGDVTGKVVPKMAMIAPPREGGSVASRYFVPHKTHAAFAVTGGLCVSSCVVLPGSVCEGVADRPPGEDCTVWIEHPTGQLDVALTTRVNGNSVDILSGGVLRTARKLMEGQVFVPSSLFEAPK